MSGDQGPTQLSKRQERLLRATLPLGIAYFALWVGWLVATLMLQPEGAGGVSWVSAAFGLIMSLLLIVSGFAYRRDLDRRKP
jgi:membrane associated rhomboid family serine protease